MKKSLVAYFSASGVTKALALRLADAIGADVYEITPQVKYTAADLDWTNKQSRSSKEMSDKYSRPAISGKAENMESYDTIFVGFPIWWYTAPTIVNTFLESYDLSGKTVVPFATSGSSGMGSTSSDIMPSCKGAKVVQGKRFASGAGAEELKKFAEQYI